MVAFGTAEEARLTALLRADHGESFRDFVARVSPHHSIKRHLEPVADLWERTRYERVFACVMQPPQTGKSTTGLHGLAWRMARDPVLSHGYATYNDQLAASKSRICRRMATGGGVEIPRGSAAVHEWQTDRGGGLLAHGYKGQWSGMPINGVALLDDLYKDRKDAESKVIRENVWEFFTDVLWPRLHPPSKRNMGASVIAQFTRWHADDLIGRLLQGKYKGYQFEEVRLPAICEDEDDILGRQIGEALWPEQMPIEELRRIEESSGPYSFASLYQQRPRPKGADIFGEPATFSLADWRPDEHRIIICCDPAATDDNRADFSAAFVLAAKGFGLDMKVWILHGWRDHITVPAVARKLYEIQQRHWGDRYPVPIAVESVGGFKAVPQILKEIEPRLRIRPIKPKGDKFTRAQGFASAWNAGRVLVPIDSDLWWDSKAAWPDGRQGRFLLPANEVTGERFARKLRAGVQAGITWADELLWEADKFTGVGDLEDDQIDALAHGYNELWEVKQSQRGTSPSKAPFG